MTVNKWDNEMERSEMRKEKDMKTYFCFTEIVEGVFGLSVNIFYIVDSFHILSSLSLFANHTKGRHKFIYLGPVSCQPAYSKKMMNKSINSSSANVYVYLSI